MIKFAVRRNLIYPTQLLFWHLLRNLETMLIDYLFEFSSSLIYTPLMFLGEFISGLIIYKSQLNFLNEKKFTPKPKSKSLIYNEERIEFPDSVRKIYIIIFFIGFFDWIQFLIWTASVPKYLYITDSIVSRLSGVLAISCALCNYFILKFPIFKHQTLSIIITTICTLIAIITEFFFQEINIFLTYGDFVVVILLTILSLFLNAYLDITEKYLFEIDYLNPFFTLMLEGLFGFFISFLFFFLPDYLDDVKLVYNNNSAGKFVLFIFLLFLYVILCGGRNVFRVITTKIYSPTTRALTDYFLNPIYHIIYFSTKNEFVTNGERNVTHFIINLILSLIISICGCVYNEFLILFCCGLEMNTHDQISKRSSTFYEMNKIYENENDDD